MLGVKELNKKPESWCDHAQVGKDKSCIIYNDRPKSCVDFECMWLMNKEMPDEYRPDKIKAVFSFTTDGQSIVVFVEPHNYHLLSEGSLDRYIKEMVNRGLVVFIVSGDERRLLYRGSKIPDHLKPALEKVRALQGKHGCSVSEKR
jgi:hypothetical protein